MRVALQEGYGHNQSANMRNGTSVKGTIQSLRRSNFEDQFFFSLINLLSL
jgi:hypothetical protein